MAALDGLVVRRTRMSKPGECVGYTCPRCEGATGVEAVDGVAEGSAQADREGPRGQRSIMKRIDTTVHLMVATEEEAKSVESKL